MKRLIKGLDPQGNPVGTKYDMVDLKTGKVWKKDVVLKWGNGFKISNELIEKKK